MLISWTGEKGTAAVCARYVLLPLPIALHARCALTSVRSRKSKDLLSFFLRHGHVEGRVI
jgi:hypothetical protein